MSFPLKNTVLYLSVSRILDSELGSRPGFYDTFCDVFHRNEKQEFIKILRKVDAEFERKTLSMVQVYNMRKRFFFYPSELRSLKPELQRVLFTTFNLKIRRIIRAAIIPNDGFAGLCIIIGKIPERISLFFEQLQYKVIARCELNIDEMVNLLRSNIIDYGAIFIFVYMKTIDGFSNLDGLYGALPHIYKNNNIPIFILFHQIYLVANFNSSLEEVILQNFETIIINQLNDEDPIVSLNHSFMQTLCDKIIAFKDTDLREIVSMCHTDYKRYGLITYSQYSKPIYLNTSPQKTSNKDYSKLRDNRKALCFIFDTFTLTNCEHHFASFEDAGRFLQLMRSLGHTVVPKIGLNKGEIISIFEIIAKGKLDDYYAIIIYFSCILMSVKREGMEKPSIVLKKGEYLLIEDIMLLSRKFPLQPTILIVNSLVVREG
ncbi:hypothetical protein B4U80_14051, partial [Leptotrombidium deliense]